MGMCAKYILFHQNGHVPLGRAKYMVGIMQPMPNRPMSRQVGLAHVFFWTLKEYFRLSRSLKEFLGVFPVSDPSPPLCGWTSPNKAL